jgi:6-pyruvoyl-tetrahydropterin synthase
MSLISDDMIVDDISDPKNSTKELLKLINNFSKVDGYKISTKISLAFLYTNDKWAEKKNRETTLFTIAAHFINYLGGNPYQTSER